MESIDLFQHRIDAWATGLAYRRLIKRRRAGRRGLVGGYWGLLGKLRPDSTTGRTDGYLHAPSLHQATTAAVLRAAHLRHRDSGASDIGLDSAQVRRALRLLELLQAGVSPGEALGYLGERKLHDNGENPLVFKLRQLFPLRNPLDDAKVEILLFDGLAFANADLGTLALQPAEVAPLRKVQTELRTELDALSDLVLAEATHLRIMGQAEGANAWLQVVSGETIPGLPSIVRTRPQRSRLDAPTRGRHRSGRRQPEHDAARDRGAFARGPPRGRTKELRLGHREHRDRQRSRERTKKKTSASRTSVSSLSTCSSAVGTKSRSGPSTAS